MRSEPKARMLSRSALRSENTKTLHQAAVELQDFRFQAHTPEQRVSAAQITGTADRTPRGDETTEVRTWELPAPH